MVQRASSSAASEQPEEEPERYALTWERFVRGVLTLKKLRGFFGVLGNWLKEVKDRGRLAGR